MCKATDETVNTVGQAAQAGQSVPFSKAISNPEIRAVTKWINKLGNNLH